MQLHVKLCPTVVGSFDVKMCVCIRECKPLYVRLTGTVEQPKISVQEVCYINIHDLLIYHYNLSTEYIG